MSGSRPPAAATPINSRADDDRSGSAALMAIARLRAGCGEGHPAEAVVIFLWVTGRRDSGAPVLAQFRPWTSRGGREPEPGHDRPQQTPGYTDPPTYKLVEPGEVLVVRPRVSDTWGRLSPRGRRFRQAERSTTSTTRRRPTRPRQHAPSPTVSGSSIAATTTTSRRSASRWPSTRPASTPTTTACRTAPTRSTTR
jgi:hypothetical protein